MFAVERGKSFGRSQDIRTPHCFLSTTGPGTNTRPIYVSFVSKATLWERGLCASVHNDHSVLHHGPRLCSRFLSHMKARPEDLKPPCFLSSKSKPRPPCEEKPYAHAPTSSKTHKLDGLKANRRYGDFHQDPGTRQSFAAAVAPCHSPTTPLPKIKQKPSSRISPGSERSQDHDVSTTLPFLQTVSSAVEDTAFKKADASLFNTNNTNLLRKHYPTEQEPLQSPASLSQSSLSDLSCPTSPFSRSLDLSDRSSILSNESFAESQSTSPEGIICSPVVHSSPVASRHASLPLYSPTNLSTSALISTKLDGQTKAPSLPQTSPVLLCKPGEDKVTVQESSTENVQAEFSHNITPHSARSSSHLSPLMSSADALSFKRSPSSPIRGLDSLWPVLPPISTIEGLCPGLLWPLAPGSAVSETDPQRKFCAALSLTYQMQRPPTVTPNLPEKPKWCTTAACCSSELSCRESQVFDELDDIAPLSASSPSLDQLSESSYSASKDTDVSPGLAALTVCCDSGNLGSLSRVQLLLLNRQEPQSPFSLDEHLSCLDNYADLDMNNGVWRPLTAGSVSEKCGSIRKAHQNKPDDLEDGSGSPCSWIIDPSPSYNMLKSSDSQGNFGLGSSGNEGVIFYTQSNYSRLNEEDVETCSTVKRIEEDRFRRREERKTKVLKMLSKLQDSSPHRPASCKGHSNFEDFDFLAKYCIFNQEKLAEYKQAFEEEDTDGDGYISCLQVLCALKSIIPPELLSEEEEIYVYRILEMVDFRVTDGLVDLRLFAVIASLAQKIATMDEFMRSLISSIDFRSLEVKLFKAKKLFLCLLEEQASDGMPQQKFISPEQLILELKAGGICLEQEAAIRMELQHIPPLDLLDFLAHLPLFMLIHRSVIANPLDDFSHL